MRYLIVLLVGLLSAPALALTPYTAVYDAKGSGVRASNLMTFSAPDSSGRMELRSVSKARGLARLLKQDPIVEYSQFEVIDGRFRPIEYHYLFNESDSSRNAWIVFDHQNLVAKSLYREETVELDIRSDDVDRLLESLVMRADLMSGKMPEKYSYVDRNSLLEAAYENLGHETISTEAGKFDTIKYRRRRVGSSRSAIIWFAPKLEYLPVQLQHFKDDKATGVVTLKHYAAGSND